MKSTYDNFIGIYDGFFTDKMCDDMIEHFEWCQKNNRTFGRVEATSTQKRDNSACLEPSNSQEIHFGFPQVQNLIGEFNDVFWNQCYKEYIDKYGVLSDYERHTIFTYKIQKTLPAEGYHVWHCEDGSMQFSRRVGVYILYLNDVEEGGETEFLYMSKRVAPKKGRLVVFPPNFPWAHRGNPPLAGEKYILTGWMEFN